MAVSFVNSVSPSGQDGHCVYFAWPYMYSSRGSSAVSGLYIDQYLISNGVLSLSSTTQTTAKVIGIAYGNASIYAVSAQSMRRYSFPGMTYNASTSIGFGGRDIVYSQPHNTLFGVPYSMSDTKLQAFGVNTTALTSYTLPTGTVIWAVRMMGDKILACGSYSGCDYLAVCTYNAASDKFGLLDSTQVTWATSVDPVAYDVDFDGKYIYTSNLRAWRWDGSVITYVASGASKMGTCPTAPTGFSALSAVGQGVWCYGGRIYVSELLEDAWSTKHSGRIEVFTFDGSDYTLQQTVSVKEDAWSVHGAGGYLATSGQTLTSGSYCGNFFVTDRWAPVATSVQVLM